MNRTRGPSSFKHILAHTVAEGIQFANCVHHCTYKRWLGVRRRKKHKVKCIVSVKLYFKKRKNMGELHKSICHEQAEQT